ncbi:hypothetical protein SAMN04488061_2790 [Filomicrobium insigne]|uniref:Uncharacterized protein n=1 Tax=Filomicrobium insigne TaxID=418854 RepID=A0A1H0S9H4_9HYPH|nr:M2 family metallopeptidase [Filomicrobium insigne]SDP38317.1 hypothetical protein SAMN04488061_2790 [Filomicrobium insigne]
MSNFTPKFPRSVSGRDWRKPLDGNDFEQLAERMDRLYSTVELSVYERAMLLKVYEGLVVLDKRWARVTWTRLSNVTVMKPYPAAPWEPGCYCNGDRDTHDAGFFWRIVEYVERLEVKHGSGKAQTVDRVEASDCVEPMDDF